MYQLHNCYSLHKYFIDFRYFQDIKLYSPDVLMTDQFYFDLHPGLYQIAVCFSAYT